MIPPNFSIQEAVICANASASAYSLATIQTPLAHFLITKQGGFNIVAARGTANWRDALTDAEFLRDGQIHSGFDRAFKSIFDDLNKSISAMDDSPRLFCGHSLGGALSVLAAFSFARAQDRVYTFGQPRIGSKSFAAQCEFKLSGRHFRFVNQEDIVPRIPLWLSGYRHSGQEIFFPSIGGIRFGAPIWYKAASDIIGTYLAWRSNREIAQIEDHGITQYAAKLSSASIGIAA